MSSAAWPCPLELPTDRLHLSVPSSTIETDKVRRAALSAASLGACPSPRHFPEGVRRAVSDPSSSVLPLCASSRSTSLSTPRSLERFSSSSPVRRTPSPLARTFT